MARFFLVLGGVFNCLMGAIFFSNTLLVWFFKVSGQLENIFFARPATLYLPQDALHLLLIHGFGASVLILGATLLYSARNPKRLLPFIFIDALGRLGFGSLMILYIFQFSLPRILFPFSFLELALALAYFRIVWTLKSDSRSM